MSESAVYLAEIDWVLGQQTDCLRGLSPHDLNGATGHAAANSPAAIVGHTLGVTAAFLFGVVLGEPGARDRAAEFATTYRDVDAAAAAITALRTRLAAADFARVSMSSVVTPSEATWGSSSPSSMELRRVCAETLRHSAIHLGELRFARSLVDQRPRA
jgi:hypothetical protein